MNSELKLKLQSSLDGELSEGEARRLAGQIDQDTEARQLLAELSMARAVLAGHEPEHKVPESREFYWSRIRREIERIESAQGALVETTLPVWRRFLTPAAAVALVAVLAIGTARFYTRPAAETPFSYEAEINSPSEDSSSFSFRSQSENMYVVWVYDRNDEVAAKSEAGEGTEIQ